MRVLTWCCIAMIGAALLTGCRSKEKRPPQTKAATARKTQFPTKDKPIVVAADTVTGKIVRVHSAGKFVVVTFPVGQLPQMEQRMGVYRNGLKVGEVKITGPQLDDSLVADILDGEARDGDTVTP